MAVLTVHHPVQVQDRIALLNEKLDTMQAKKEQLWADVDLCEKKLSRATELIGGLGGEKARWSEAAKSLSSNLQNVPGSILLASGCVAYLGAFTAPYRCVSLLLTCDPLRHMKHSSSCCWLHGIQSHGPTCGQLLYKKLESCLPIAIPDIIVVLWSLK
jgi:hypothetical protein